MIQIDDIAYEIVWDKFKPYASFFIPCFNIKEAKRKIRLVCSERKLKVRMKAGVEDHGKGKVRGIRVWRLE